MTRDGNLGVLTRTRPGPGSNATLCTYGVQNIGTITDSHPGPSGSAPGTNVDFCDGVLVLQICTKDSRFHNLLSD